MKTIVSFATDKITFTNSKTNKAVSLPYLERIDGKEAATHLRKDMDARVNVTRAALTVLVDVFQSERLAGYKGTVSIGEKAPAEFRLALREAESAHIRPLFLETLGKMPSAVAGKLADKYVNELWAMGVYPLVKSNAATYFCQVGKLPCAYNEDGTPDTSRLLSVDAMKKLIQAHREENTIEQDDTFTNKYVRQIVRLSSDFAERKDSDVPPEGEIASAIAALRGLMTAFEAFKKAPKLSTVRVGDVMAVANVALDKAKKTTKAKKTPEPKAMVVA